MPTRLLLPSLRRLLIGLMVAAFVLTQALGAVHRVMNGHAAAAAAADEAGARLLKALFAGHHDERDCKVFDQLAQADLAGGVANEPAADVAGETPVKATHRSWHIAAQAAGFLARGPPASA
jgi:hypothetical protein